MSAASEPAGVVITVVYDGPPRAGKTTSVRALGRSLGREVYTPEERDGRTVYFDWLEHTGGRFEGLPIRCQVASVPGQRHWRRRRGHFLERADVVVFVGDTTARAWPETVARLAELRRALDDRAGTPVGLVFQANKRDCADAVSEAELHACAAGARTAVIESVAETGLGVREAFVFAVRLALDRVRAEAGDLAQRPGFGVGAASELLAALREVDADPPAGELVPGAEPAPREPAADADVRPPSLDVPSGFVWPPVEGRIVLREAGRAVSRVAVDDRGDCVASAGGWRLHSSARAVFADVELGRARLVAWARRHAAVQALLSRRRCIVLAATGDGRWRLWQVVRAEPSLRALGRADGPALLDALAAELARTGAPLPCTLDTVGIAAEAARPVFIDLVPHGEAA